MELWDYLFDRIRVLFSFDCLEKFAIKYKQEKNIFNLNK